MTEMVRLDPVDPILREGPGALHLYLHRTIWDGFVGSGLVNREGTVITVPMADRMLEAVGQVSERQAGLITAVAALAKSCMGLDVTHLAAAQAQSTTFWEASAL